MSDIQQEEIILCGSSAYNKKFYLNERFAGLPEGIREDLKIMCVLYTEEIGGTFQMVFDEDGQLMFRTDCNEGDYFYDEIGSALKIKQLQRDRQELLESLEMYYKVFFLGEEFTGEE